MTEPADRHISFATLDEYVEAGVLVTFPIDGDPGAMLTIDPANDVLRLDLNWDGEQPPDIGEYVYITTAVRHHHGTNWVSLAVHGKRFFADAYPLIRSVADSVQLGDATFADAVGQSVRQYHELLTSTGRMPDTDEIGLWGELFVLRHLLTTMTPATALAAWRGGDQPEEHDFGLPDDDVEVKTTIADVRRHWIGSLTQLEPSVNRPLWLLSIQVTNAGSSSGTRLTDLIDQITATLPPTQKTLFADRVKDTSYRPGQPRDTYRLLRLRTSAACYPVVPEFPRLTPALLTAGGADTSRIDQVAYTIRLDGLPLPAVLPEPLHAIDKKVG